LKEKGHPWERAKAFDGACPLSEFIEANEFIDLNSIELKLTKNDEVQQQGSSSQMLFPILPLIAEMSRHFTLNPGDVVITGTPAGVGPIEAGDSLVAELSVGDVDLKVQTSVN